MLKIRRPLGRLIFNMGIAIPGKTVFLIETAPSWLSKYKYNYRCNVSRCENLGINFQKSQITCYSLCHSCYMDGWMKSRAIQYLFWVAWSPMPQNHCNIFKRGTEKVNMYPFTTVYSIRSEAAFESIQDIYVRCTECVLHAKFIASHEEWIPI